MVHLSPLGSQAGFEHVTRIENVVDWEVIAKKYRALMRDEPDDLALKDSDTEAAEDAASGVVPNNVALAPTWTNLPD